MAERRETREAAPLTGHRSGSRTPARLECYTEVGDRAHHRGSRNTIYVKSTFRAPGVRTCPSLFLGAGGAEKGAYNPNRPAATMPGVPSPYPEVQTGCTGCRVHPRCTKALATIIKQDVEYSRGAEHRRHHRKAYRWQVLGLRVPQRPQEALQRYEVVTEVKDEARHDAASGGTGGL
jgi:hypothetical protein